MGNSGDAFDRLSLDYQTTVGQIQMLTDIRFKLLALVPAVAGFAMATDKVEMSDTTRGLAVIGFVATLGVLVYDLRNSQLYSAAMHRAKELEKLLGFAPSNIGPFLAGVPTRLQTRHGGVYTERPPTLRLLLLHVKHDIALAIIYSVSLAGWIYLFAASFGNTTIAWRSAAAAAILFFALLWVFDHRGDNANSAANQLLDDYEPRKLVRLLVRPGQLPRAEEPRSIYRQRVRQLLMDANRPVRVFHPDGPDAAMFEAPTKPRPAPDTNSPPGSF